MPILLKFLIVAAAMLMVPTFWTTSQPASNAAAQAVPTMTVLVPTVTLTVATPTAGLPTMTLTPTISATVPPTLPVDMTATTTTTTTATPNTTLTPGPTVTPGGPAPDLMVTTLEAPPVVPVDGVIPYFMTITNLGNAASAATTALSQIPPGTVIDGFGQGCSPATGNGFNAISCAVPALQSGQSVSFTFGIRPVAGPGQVVNNVLVDPGNTVVETNEANNTMSRSTIVAPPAQQVGQPGFPPPPVPISPELPVPFVPVAPGAPAPVAPPIDVAGVQVPPPQANPGELWIQILAPTQAYSIEMEPLWVATPGEWYIVTEVEEGWALSVWEGDTTGWSVWIPMDERVNAVTVDRADPTIATEVWLVSHQSTEALSTTSMELAWVTAPGEWYRVLQHDNNWAMVVYETDPLSNTVWIRLDSRVELAPGDAGHSPA